MINSNAQYSGLANIMNMRNPNQELAYVPNGYFSSDEYSRYYNFKYDRDLKEYAKPFRLDTFDHYVKKVKYL